MSVVIYHNPRCSKSRITLQLLLDRDVEPEIVEYLKTQPSFDEISEIVKILGIKPIELVRKGESEYKLANLNDNSPDTEVIAAMVKYPKLIERPVVINGDRGAIGRPPENILDIL